MKFLCLIILIFISFDLHAQGSADGCLIPSDNKVYTDYTSLLGARLYINNPSVPLSPNYCSWTSSSTVPCNVCFGSINALALLCVGGPVIGGRQGTYTMVQCNLDDYSWALGSTAAFFGFIFIRRRIKK